MHYVYILRLSNGGYYTGSAGDLKRRIAEHKAGKSPATSRFLPITLVSYVAFDDKGKAEKFEGYLKGGSGIAFRNRHLV